MSDFLADNLSLPANKIDNSGTSRTVASPTKHWSPDDANRVFAALLSIQTYLRANTFNLIDTVTIKDLEVVANSSPSVAPEVDLKGNRGAWFWGIDVANADTSRDLVLAGQRGTYAFSDGATTSGSPTLTSATRGGFTTALIGATISGSGIPNGTTISAVGGTTSLTMSANATATASGVAVTITRNTAADIIYLKHRGALAPTIGMGVTPPDGSARLQVSPEDTEATMGGIALRVGPSQTADAFFVYDSGATKRLRVTKDFYLTGDHPIGGAVIVQADATNARALVMTDNAKSTFYGFTFPGGNTTAFRCISGGNDSFIVGTDGSLRHVSTKIGFFAAAAGTKPTVTGSRGGNAALASLLTALATLGLVTDSTTA